MHFRKPSATNRQRTSQGSLTILIQGSIRDLSGDHLMSSISSLGSGQNTYSSPLQQLEAELQSEVSAGTVSSSDESALSSALTSIDSSLSAGQSSSQTAGSPDGTGGSGPGDIKSKIN